MIVDLQSRAFNHLRLDITLEADREKVKGLAEGLKLSEQPESHYSAAAMFRRSGQVYGVLARICVDAEAESAPYMNLQYDLRETVPLSGGLRSRLQEIGSILGDLAAPCSVECFAWGAVPRDRYESIIEIPAMRFRTPRMPFDELRGVRLVKLEDGVEKSSVALDVHTKDDLLFYLSTKFTATSHPRLSSDALRRLVELKNQALVEVP